MNIQRIFDSGSGSLLLPVPEAEVVQKFFGSTRSGQPDSEQRVARYSACAWEDDRRYLTGFRLTIVSFSSLIFSGQEDCENA